MEIKWIRIDKLCSLLEKAMTEKPMPTRNRAQDKDEEATGVLLKEMKVIQSKVDNIEKQLNSKVDGLYGSLEKILKSELKKCVKEIQDNIDLEIGALKSRLDLLEQKLLSSNSSPSNKFDPDVSIIIMGLPYDKEEDLEEKLGKVLEVCCTCEQIPTPTAIERLRARGPGPGVVRVEFASVREKVDVLRGKRNLKSNPEFAKVYVRSAKSHTDRIMEINFKTLLRDLPLGKDFYMAGNGRLIK